MDAPTPLPRPFAGQKGYRVPNTPALVTVWDIATGASFAVKPISAKEGVAAGVWSRTPPEPVAPTETPETPTESASAKKSPRKR